MKVGIPVLKCSLHPSQQINKKTGKRSKTCGINSAWKELNDERLGRDPTIDKEMTNLNVWMEGNTNMDIEKIVKDKIEQINLTRKEHGKRSLRADAVSVIAIVEKPNMDYMKNLSYEQKVEFLNKSHQVMKNLIHEWNSSWQVLVSLQHHDEFGGLSAHNHSLVLVSTIDEDGLPNMKAKSEVNLKFFNFINKNYAPRMRSFGYEVEDVKTFDQLSEEEKIERKLNPKEHGVEAYKYKQKKEQELNQSIEQKEIKNQELQQQLDNIVQEMTEAPNLASYKKVIEENAALKEELNLKEKLIRILESELKNITRKFNDLKNSFNKITNAIGTKILTIIGINKIENIKNDFPSKDVLDQLNKIQKERLERSAKNFRIVPDKTNEGKYTILYRNNDGSYETIKDDINSRVEAEHKVKEFSNISLNLTENQLEIDKNE